jgi:hypothetical protein
VTIIWCPVLGNVSVNTPGQQQRISVAGKHVVRGYGVLNVFSVRCSCLKVIGANEGRLQSVTVVKRTTVQMTKLTL